ncbi:transferrin-like [Oppia nitens]|uniref:transferrin-like n=1 Tax=Oppia nitens TaxID=1686743 RepID=UPI0023DCD358|nr:transferrin-like [Oppia nitens]
MYNSIMFDLINQIVSFSKHYIIIMIISSIYIQSSLTQTVKIRYCVPDSLYDYCVRMSDNVPGTFSCINARDKYECIRLIDRDEADIVNLDAEDLYLAGRLYGLEPFIVEEFNGNIYKHRSGVLVHRNININSISDLKNKRACLGPYGSDSGWNIPVGLLLATDTLVPDCKGEIDSVNNFFGVSCAAGMWSNDSYLDQQLKRKHSNLCGLCKDPVMCSEKDPFAGDEGVIKCLLEGQGEVAFTSIETADSYFKSRPELKDSYQFLCLDGSRMPITRRACEWARRPTNAFVIRKGRARQKDYYLRYLQQIFFRYSQLKPQWFTKTFVSSENVTQLVSMPFNTQQWDKYLGNYIPSIEKPLPGCERQNVTFCLTSSQELAKCLDLQKAAFARRIRPQIRCHSSDSHKSCVDAINMRKADIISLDASLFYKASRYDYLLPIATEITNSPQYSVAVVRADSLMTSLADLKGKRSCHTGFGQTSGWVVPVGALIDSQVIDNHNCNRAESMARLFSGSCVPGAADARINTNGTGVDSLCSQCIGDDNSSHICEMSSAERFSGEDGAFRCLVEGRGDVAFLSHTTAIDLTDHKSNQLWAKDLRSVDFRLLCANRNNSSASNSVNVMNGYDLTTIPNPNSIHNSQRYRLNSFLAPIQDYQTCHLAHIPAPIVATSSAIDTDVRLQILQLLTSLSDTFTNKVPQSFRLFGVYRNHSDLMFNDKTIRLASLPPETTYAEALHTFLPFIEYNDHIVCTNSGHKFKSNFITFHVFSIFIINLYFIN